jgi:hypothetical protein
MDPIYRVLYLGLERESYNYLMIFCEYDLF